MLKLNATTLFLYTFIKIDFCNIKSNYVINIIFNAFNGYRGRQYWQRQSSQ